MLTPLLDALLQPNAHLLVVTGAGISRASGIQTFRGSDPGAVWNTSDVDMATQAMLRRDPVGHWRWYLDRFAAVDGAQPNPAHTAVRDLETELSATGRGFSLITQNIDLLHEQAGSASPIKIHGTSGRVRCSAAGCRQGEPAGSIDRATVGFQDFSDRPSSDTLPKCPECGAFLRPHVLFFDEFYTSHVDYQFENALEAAAVASVILFVGTSFSVGATDLVIRAGWQSRASMFSIDPHATPPAGTRIIHLREAAEVLLPQLVEQLRRSDVTRQQEDS